MLVRISFIVVAAVLLLVSVHGARADENPMQGEKPKEEKVPEKFGAPAPIRIFGAPGGRIEVRSSVHNGASSISRTTINGVTKLEAREGRAVTRITEDPAEGVTVETTKSYDRSNMEEIKESHPNIYSYLEKAPQGMGPTTFRVTIEVGEKYQAKSLDELKENHPKAFETYQKYMQDSAAPAIRAFPRIRIDAPAFDVFPKRIEVKPAEPKKIEKEEKPMANGSVET